MTMPATATSENIMRFYSWRQAATVTRESFGAVSATSSQRLHSIPRSQRYFWTPEWQQGERLAEEEYRLGLAHRFSDIRGMLNWLQSEDAE